MIEEEKEQWLLDEQTRTIRLTSIMNRNLSEIHKAALEIIESIQFPFSTTCDTYIDDDANLYIHLDLPEIEDVIPTHRKSILKNGTIKEILIAELDRNRDYFQLTLGQGVLIAMMLCSALPVVPSIKISAYTQRQRRSESDPIDTYVFDVCYHRSDLAKFETQAVQLQEFVMGLNPLMDLSDKMKLNPIQPSEWVLQVKKMLQHEPPEHTEDGGSEACRSVREMNHEMAQNISSKVRPEAD
jgi:hypothetical protein